MTEKTAVDETSNYSCDNVAKIDSHIDNNTERMNDTHYRYDEVITPYKNAIFYVLFLIASVITQPIIILSEDSYKSIIKIIYFASLVLIAVFSFLIDTFVNKRRKESFIMRCLVKYENNSAIFCYAMTSFGYIVLESKPCFVWSVYFFELSLFLLLFYFFFIMPVLKNRVKEYVHEE